MECFQLWKLPLSLELDSLASAKNQTGSVGRCVTIHTHTFSWSCLWWWNSVCACRNATSSKPGKLQQPQGSTDGKPRQCHRSNIIKSLLYFTPVLSPITHPWHLISRTLLHHQPIPFIKWLSYCSPFIWADSEWFLCLNRCVLQNKSKQFKKLLLLRWSNWMSNLIYFKWSKATYNKALVLFYLCFPQLCI